MLVRSTYHTCNTVSGAEHSIYSDIRNSIADIFWGEDAYTGSNSQVMQNQNKSYLITNMNIYNRKWTIGRTQEEI